MQKLEVTFSDEEWLSLQSQQRRNGETLSDTLLRLAGIRGEESSESHELLLGLCDLISNGHTADDILGSRFWNADLKYYFDKRY